MPPLCVTVVGGKQQGGHNAAGLRMWHHLVKGKKPGSSGSLGSCFTSSAVYRGLMAIPSGLLYTKSCGPLPLSSLRTMASH